MFNLDKLVDECRYALRDPNPLLRTQEIVWKTVSDPASIEAALGAEEVPEEGPASYITLYQSSELSILRVLMPPRLASPAHNHLAWAVIGIYKGGETDTFYRRKGTRIEETDRRDIAAPEVMVLDAEVIHSIRNPLKGQSCALHVYGGDLTDSARSLWNPSSLEEEGFQLAKLLAHEREMTARASRGKS